MCLFRAAFGVLRYFWSIAVDIFVGFVTWILKFGALKTFIEYVESRPLTKETLFLVWENWPVVVQFLVDLMEPMKRYASADSENATPSAPEDTKYLPYNELDLDVAMNRHGIVCQVQRLLKSIIPILANATGRITGLRMDTVLESDRKMTTCCKVLTIPTASHGKDEEWLFINGICNEYYWTVLSVNKLAKRFFNYPAPANAGPIVDGHTISGRQVNLTGVFNRSDGILWDLIECGSQRDFGNASQLGIKEATEVTESSRAAQKLLRDQLKAALANSKQDIVMIAHSQGCLVLRLVLRDFKDENRYPDLHKLLPRMRECMSVYTFGNPAYEWDCHKIVRHTEHFANKWDFVAQLGVLGSLRQKAAQPPSRGLYKCEDCEKGTKDHPKMLIWENEKRRGHLFGSQYSLDQKDYRLVFPHQNKSARSELLSRGVEL